MGKEKKKKKKSSKKSKHSSKEKVEKKRRYTSVVTEEDRLRVKAEKRARKKQALLGYTNQNNPFGDAQLSKPFVWHKKNQKDIVTGKATRAPTQAEQRSRRDVNIQEIKKVQKRREARERDKLEQEELRDLEMRLRVNEEFQDWEERERDFHQNQAKRGVLTRVLGGREKVIDVLAKNYLILDPPKKSVHDDPDSKGPEDDIATIELERRAPYEIFEGLPVRDLEELLEEVRDFVGMTKFKEYGDYWKELAVLVAAELRQARVLEQAAEGTRNSGMRGVSKAVEADLRQDYSAMSTEELSEAAADIQRTIKEGHHRGATVDVEFMEKQLQMLREFRARARLRELHEAMLEQRLEHLAKRSFSSKHDKNMTGLQRAEAAVRARLAGASGDGEDKDDDTRDDADADADAEVAIDYEDLSPELEPAEPEQDGDGGALELDEDALCLSPTLEPLPDDDDGSDSDVADADEDAMELKLERAIVLRDSRSRLVRAAQEAVAAAPDESKEAARMYAAERGKADGDELKGSEVAIPAQIYTWTDKYRPRKPRYFNRVKTGYEWNKYNQSHYDHDNPPPKCVQGYKFNIFYPDLLDRTKVPKYFKEPADSPDFCILRFHAGPPYEDIAFKIVNHEWAYQRKRGFKCVFERGILHLYVNFKRHFYRR